MKPETIVICMGAYAVMYFLVMIVVAETRAARCNRELCTVFANQAYKCASTNAHLITNRNTEELFTALQALSFLQLLAVFISAV